MNLMEKDNAFVAHTYRRFPVTLASGRGSLVTDTDGKEYIDMGSGIGVTAFGFCDALWQKAVTEQIATLQHASNLYYTKPCIDLAQCLAEKTGMQKVFFSNSGAEANECAIKTARKRKQDRTDRDDAVIITLQNSFHGRTIATLAATGQEVFHKTFGPFPKGFVSVPAEDVNALSEVAKNRPVAAVMVECVQGEGGVVALSEEYLRAAEAFAREQDALFIVDEVQTGNGRTGKLFAYMHAGLTPDIVTTAKGLAGGLPMGATLFGERAADVLSYGDHGSTFGGNPVAAAGALSVLQRLDDAFLQEVEKKGELIFESLTGAPGIESVSGKGLMIGVKTKKEVSQVLAECREEGVLFLSAKEKVRLLPALNIPLSLLMKAVEVLKKVAADLPEEA